MNADSRPDVHVVLIFRYVIVFFSFQVIGHAKCLTRITLLLGELHNQGRQFAFLYVHYDNTPMQGCKNIIFR